MKYLFYITTTVLMLLPLVSYSALSCGALFGGRSEKMNYVGANNVEDQYYLSIDTRTFPPIIQALNGKRLENVRLPTPQEIVDNLEIEGVPAKVERSMPVELNCHSIAWNTLRQIQNPKSHDIELQRVDDFTADEAFSRFPTIEKNELAFGDIILIRSSVGELWHSAIYLGNGRIFEKTDSGENDPIRIAYLEDVLRKYDRLEADKHTVEFRHTSNTYKLPSIKEAMGTDHKTAQSDYKLGALSSWSPAKWREWIIDASDVRGFYTGAEGPFVIYVLPIITVDLVIDGRTGLFRLPSDQKLTKHLVDLVKQ